MALAEQFEHYLPDVEATEAFGGQLILCPAFNEFNHVHLQGDLGAGKTTLVRGMLRALGYTGAVRSPTYTLMEPYVLAEREVLHLDLYRLADPEELEYLGLREQSGGGTLWLVEWPERGRGWLPVPDLVVNLAQQLPGRRVTLSGLGLEHLLAACPSLR